MKKRKCEVCGCKQFFGPNKAYCISCRGHPWDYINSLSLLDLLDKAFVSYSGPLVEACGLKEKRGEE